MDSEREKERVMEKVEIEHPYHEHPLILREIVDSRKEILECYGCRDVIDDREWAYVCVQEMHCSRRMGIGTYFHKRCAELPTKISHPSHPQHPLYLFDFNQLRTHRCDLCRRELIWGFAYRCSHCDFDLDVTCKKLGKNEIVVESTPVQHACHRHPLKLIRVPPFVFSCGACGNEDRDTMYACTTCDFLIHKACTLLPPVLLTNHHHHQLSLSSSFPFHHRDFGNKCSLCAEHFNLVFWVYYCGDCRFFAHLRCVTSELQFPLEECEIFEKLITPFVIRERGMIPSVNDMLPSITIPVLKSFCESSPIYHVHTLSLVSELSHQDVDDDVKVKKKICDECTTLISSPPFYKCVSCNYFAHAICHLLPKTLSSLQSQQYGYCPNNTKKTHIVTLCPSSKRYEFMPKCCDICGFATNGMVYTCENYCSMMVDVKCACLPTIIKHASHPHHKLIKSGVAEEERSKHKCRGCGALIHRSIQYLCKDEDCDFELCPKCILLPKSVMKREWDEHPLLLTYDASVDHPSDFYCGVCEEEMDPKDWMYHCRPCDNSFHPRCLQTRSGFYKNFKFGSPSDELRYMHPHPLIFSYITLRLRCDICREDVYSHSGFVCSSCNYVVCLRCKILLEECLPF